MRSFGPAPRPLALKGLLSTTTVEVRRLPDRRAHCLDHLAEERFAHKLCELFAKLRRLVTFISEPGRPRPRLTDFTTARRQRNRELIRCRRAMIEERHGVRCQVSDFKKS
jgi:hypothetical protein